MKMIFKKNGGLFQNGDNFIIDYKFIFCEKNIKINIYIYIYIYIYQWRCVILANGCYASLCLELKIGHKKG